MEMTTQSESLFCYSNSMNKLAGKVVVVTGASSGIGWETAIAFSRQGAKVVAVARNLEKLKELQPLLAGEPQDHLIFPADVTQEPMMALLLSTIEEKYNCLDILVHNAAVGYLSSLEKLKMEILRKLFETNYFSIVRLTQLALPLLKSSKGHLIMISSVIGRVSVPLHLAYCSSKFSLEAFSEAIRPELVADGVRVSVFCPPLVETNFSQNSFREETSRKKWAKPFKPDRIAQKIVQLAQKPKRDWVYSFGGKFLLWVHTFFPRFVDFVFRKVKSQPED